MAPSISELQQPTSVEQTPAEKLKSAGGRLVPDDPSYAYSKYLPYQSPPDVKDEPLQYFDHVDAGSRADPSFPNLLPSNAEALSVRHLSPYLGTEVSGVQLSELNKEGLDELALFVAQRKVVAFRNQNLKDVSEERLVDLIKHFGPLHIHPIAVATEGHPELAVVYRDGERPGFADALVGARINYTGWHSDVSYEKQPPGTTFFYRLDAPEVGADTLFLSGVEAYKRLSPSFQKLLLGLKAVHTAVPQAEVARKRGMVVRREPVETEHPIIRVHPVTKERTLFVNPGFTTRIVGFKKEESDALLKFLFDHLQKGADFQVRMNYEEGTVVIWDNRVTAHSAIPGDIDKAARRHHVRLTPQAEKPIAATKV